MDIIDKLIIYLAAAATGLLLLGLLLGLVFFLVAFVYAGGSQGGILLGVFLDAILVVELAKRAIPAVKGVRL